ncbi:YdcF family protein [Pseudoscardovia radai]|uniref:YdcF family protein n=1 Tax=Pseudoscardovia radai TaxID=987066 RepID=UPI003994C7C5
MMNELQSGDPQDNRNDPHSTGSAAETASDTIANNTPDTTSTNTATGASTDAAATTSEYTNDTATTATTNAAADTIIPDIPTSTTALTGASTDAKTTTTESANDTATNATATNATATHIHFPLRQTATAIVCIAAFASLWYARAVYNTHTGTSFWLFWVALALALGVWAAAIWFHWWRALPNAARIPIGIVLCVALCSFGMSQAAIVSHMRDEGNRNLDYIIVLGAQVYQGSPSLVLRYRLDKAAEYLRANPGTTCIVSGGQGPNEPYAEARGMADYLEHDAGIDASRIIEEPDSSTTVENLRNSRAIIDSANNTGSSTSSTVSEPSIGIVTNDFHVFRSLQIAHDQGYTDVRGIAAGSPRDMLLNNMVRESFAEAKYLIKR